MFSWFSRWFSPPPAPPTEKPVRAAMIAHPIVVDPAGGEALRLGAARLTHIRNYLAQREAEGRPVDPKKLAHLQTEMTVLAGQLKLAGIEV